MSHSIHNPHDRFFKLMMKDSRVARDFFDMHLPQDLQEVIQWESLKSEKSDHINRDFNESVTDMVFSVLINDKTAYLHLIVDHQSTPDILMPFRSENYRYNQIDAYVKLHPDTKSIPLVIPIVLYHGKASWTYDMDIRSLVDAPRHLVDAYAFKPFIFINLHKIEDEKLREYLWSGVMQLAQKYIFEQDILPYVKDMLSLFRELEHKNGYEVIEAVLKYLLERGEMNKASFVDLVEKELSPKIGDKIMTVAEQFIAEGTQKGTMRVAKSLLSHGFDFDVVAENTGLSVEVLERLQREAQTEY